MPGPKPFAVTGQPERTHRLSVYVTEAELAQIEALAGAVHKRAPAYLRELALERMPPVVPAANLSAIAELGRIGRNLNQLARAANTGELAELAGQVIAELLDTQQALRGLRGNQEHGQ